MKELQVNEPTGESFCIALPDEELVAELLHEEWRLSKLANGVTSRKDAATGEELMVDYRELSEAAKELNRGPVRTVYRAIHTLTSDPTTETVRAAQ